MRPILFHLGPLPIYSFGVMVALGVILSLWLMNRRSLKTGFPQGDGAFDMVFLAVVSGFLGARFYYVLQNADWYAQNPLKIFALWEGGLIFYGGLIAAFLALWIFSRVKKISFLKIMDFLFPYVALTHAFGRLGCFLNGCCYGKICELPWGVTFPQLPYAVHPTQLYESGLDVLLFLFLNARYEKKRFEGEVALLYFMLYAGIRFFVEIFRDDNPMWSIFTINQWISVTAFVIAACFYIFWSKKAKIESNAKPAV